MYLYLVARQSKECSDKQLAIRYTLDKHTDQGLTIHSISYDILELTDI